MYTLAKLDFLSMGFFFFDYLISCLFWLLSSRVPASRLLSAMTRIFDSKQITANSSPKWKTSNALTVLNAQQLPHCPWSLTAVTYPSCLQSTVSGSAETELFSWNLALVSFLWLLLLDESIVDTNSSLVCEGGAWRNEEDYKNHLKFRFLSELYNWQFILLTQSANLFIPSLKVDRPFRYSSLWAITFSLFSTNIFIRCSSSASE